MSAVETYHSSDSDADIFASWCICDSQPVPPLAHLALNAFPLVTNNFPFWNLFARTKFHDGLGLDRHS